MANPGDDVIVGEELPHTEDVVEDLDEGDRKLDDDDNNDEEDNNDDVDDLYIPSIVGYLEYKIRRVRHVGRRGQ